MTELIVTFCGNLNFYLVINIGGLGDPSAISPRFPAFLPRLAVNTNLAEALGLYDKLPHCTPLRKISAHSRVMTIVDGTIRTIDQAAGEPEFGQGSGDDIVLTVIDDPRRLLHRRAVKHLIQVNGCVWEV